MIAPPARIEGGRGPADIQRTDPDGGDSRETAGERDAQASVLSLRHVIAARRDEPGDGSRRPATVQRSSGNPSSRAERCNRSRCRSSSVAWPFQVRNVSNNPRPCSNVRSRSADLERVIRNKLTSNPKHAGCLYASSASGLNTAHAAPFHQCFLVLGLGIGIGHDPAARPGSWHDHPRPGSSGSQC